MNVEVRNEGLLSFQKFPRWKSALLHPMPTKKIRALFLNFAVLFLTAVLSCLLPSFFLVDLRMDLQISTLVEDMFFKRHCEVILPTSNSAKNTKWLVRLWEKGARSGILASRAALADLCGLAARGGELGPVCVQPLHERWAGTHVCQCLPARCSHKLSCVHACAAASHPCSPILNRPQAVLRYYFLSILVLRRFNL